MRERKINLDDAIALIEDKLASGKEVSFSPSGISMLPTLKEGRDSVILVSPPQRLKKYDIALFRRQNGQYVLHRVVKTKNHYTFMGDNQFWCEKDIKHEQIVALCTAYVRNGKRVNFSSFHHRVYARFWHCTRPLRRGFRVVLRKFKSLVKRIIKR